MWAKCVIIVEKFPHFKHNTYIIRGLVLLSKSRGLHLNQ